MNDKIEKAIKNATRMSSYAAAARWNEKQIKPGYILLGDDGKYWVTANLRDGQILAKAGYEVAPGF
jgi:hypothetical protein